ncbi:MAG: ArsR family transcriptional regulator [Clostridiales bacterium]|nr:ArsR family transcriptional regulator [Clostridiales bacterium]
MKSFIEECVADSDYFENDDADEQEIMKNALTEVLPIIVKNELTEKQSVCLRLFYVQRKSQTEIARELKISQPTVSKHIASGKAIAKKIMTYCYYSVKKTNEQWLNLQ